MNEKRSIGNLYELCIGAARNSSCQKRGFGCILMMGGSIVTITNNHPLDVSKHICDPECIRFKINSGTDSMIGACGHAEEHAIHQAIYNGFSDLSGAILFVAGVIKPDNTPYIKTDPYFYCIRCATLMNFVGIREVNVWFEDKWHPLTPEEAYKSSLDFALKIREA